MASDPVRRSKTKTAAKAKVAVTQQPDLEVCRYLIPVEIHRPGRTKPSESPFGTETAVELVPCNTPWSDHTPELRMAHMLGAYEDTRLPYNSETWREFL